MAKAKHTPGPWVWQAEDECLVGPHQVVMRQDDEGRKVFAVYQDGTERANARLIAAAPDLLEALKAIATGRDKDGMKVDFPQDIARAAIAKATE